MRIFFAVVCHNFQRRFAWQLSSLAQQNQFDAELVVDVACLPDNGEPSTEYLAYAFQDRLDVRLSYYDGETFARRGLVRNEQIKLAESVGADWVFFADCDNVYHPVFFQELVMSLNGEHKNAKNCLYSVEKLHTDPMRTNYHARLAKDRSYIPDAYGRAIRIPMIHKENKICAAGCMQVVRLDAIMKKGGMYVHPGQCLDYHLFRRGQRARSDKQFREMMGGGTRLFLPVQIHLNHERDKELGHHSEAQR